MSTFLADLDEMGLKRTRRTVDTHKLTGFVIQSMPVAHGLQEFYNFKKVLELSWPWTGDDFSLYKARQFLFRETCLF